MGNANDILGLSPEARRALADSAAINPGVAAFAVLRVENDGADEETVTIGNDVYELDRADDGVTAGRIAVTTQSDDTPAEVTDALIAAINTSGTEPVLAIDIDANEVLVVAADGVGGNPVASDTTLAVAETLGGVDNEWDTAALRGGVAPEAERNLVVIARAPDATEVGTGNFHVVVPFTPLYTIVEVKDTNGDRKAWDGATSITGQRVTLDNSGSTDWAATDEVTVLIVG